MKAINVIIIIILFTCSLFAQSDSLKDSAAKKGEWKTYLIDDFETCENWPVVNTPLFKNKWLKYDPFQSIIKGGPKALSAPNKNYCLGVKTHMDSMGDTRKFVIPVHKVVIPGICQKISFWINSRNKPVTIKLMVQDHMNYFHYLEGDTFVLDHYGWKKIEFNEIDKRVPQVSSAAPDYLPLKILAIILENPLEKVFYKDVYFYIDQLEAYCRVDELINYDGSDIKDRW
ncbi:MAG: hypothetical protein KKH98_15845 [Spirochaetes bacterium]|nr:hypothetical protein [Spirochaetota bacterium]